MRLSSDQQEKIIKAVNKFDPHAKILLYGSRVDDTLKGGDIDLIIISKIAITKLDLLVELKKTLGDQRIDLMVYTEEKANNDAFYISVSNTTIPIR